MYESWLKYLLLAVLILSVISLILCIWLPIWQSFRIIFGVILVLFMPGFVWSWVFWKSKELDIIERFTLSLALSIAIVPLFIFLLNKVGFKINLINSIVEIISLLLTAIVVLAIQNKFLAKKISSIKTNE